MKSAVTPPAALAWVVSRLWTPQQWRRIETVSECGHIGPGVPALGEVSETVSAFGWVRTSGWSGSRDGHGVGSRG
jgi:hypothetical protein